MLAVALPLTLTTDTPAPTLTAPIWMPIAKVFTSRSETAATTRPPAGLVDRGVAVDVGVLRAGVVHDRDLAADRDEAADAGDRPRRRVLVHRRPHADLAVRGDRRGRADLRVGVAVDGHHEDRGADTDQAAGERAGQARHVEVVDRPDADVAAGGHGCVDVRRRAAGRRAEGGAGHRGARRGRGDLPVRVARTAEERVRDAAVGRRISVRGGPERGVRVGLLVRARLDRGVLDAVEGHVVAGGVGGDGAPRRSGGPAARRPAEDALVAVAVAGRDAVGAGDAVVARESLRSRPASRRC